MVAHLLHFFSSLVLGLHCETLFEKEKRDRNPAFSQLELVADKNSSLNATDQIRKVFGKYSIESPDLFEGNHQDFEHIQMQTDAKLGSCFVFFIHRDLDGDMDKHWPPGKERQRNEIKGYEGSPQVMKASSNETSSHVWYFKIDPAFSLTHQSVSYTHLTLPTTYSV